LKKKLEISIAAWQDWKKILAFYFSTPKSLFSRRKKKPNFLRFYGLKSAESNNKKRAQI